MSSKRSSSSATIIGGNDDLLIEILVFLPAKSLVRFKVVSKQWRSIISSPFFSRLHTLHHPGRPFETQPLFILGNGDGSKYFVCNPATSRLSPFPLLVGRFPRLFGFPFMEILQSCNGILLLRCRKTKNGRSYYYVLNPTTMQQRDLSPLPSNSVAGLRLIFDPSLSPLYRVVCFVGAKNCILVYLYDSGTHKWKLGGQSIGRKMSFRNGIYFNGGICFLRFRDSSHFIPDDGSLSNIPNLPRHHCLGRVKNYVMESNGVVLCLTLSRRNKEGSNLLHVSEMKEIENGWSNKYRADMNPILATCGGRDCTSIHSIHLLCMFMGEKEQDSLLLLRVNGKIVSYKFYDDVFEVIVDYTSEEFQKENREWYAEDAHHFIHSLAPV